MTTRKPTFPDLPEEVEPFILCETAIGAGFIGLTLSSLPYLMREGIRRSLLDALAMSDERIPPTGKFVIELTARSIDNPAFVPDFLNDIGKRFRS